MACDGTLARHDSAVLGRNNTLPYFDQVVINFGILDVHPSQKKNMGVLRH
jgi:hypothetical protein